jgi:hypothetical protein
MIAVICLCVGSKYDDQYPVKLRNMVSRYITSPYRFICFSDRLIDGVETILIDNKYHLDGVWYKLWLLQHPILHQFSKKLFFDLDVIIHNNVDWLLSINDNRLTVIESVWKDESVKNTKGNTGYNSSVMIWTDAQYVWNKFNQSPDRYMITYKGIDRFLWNENIDINTIHHNKIYSYREGLNRHDDTPYLYRNNCDICIFNQYPKPHQLSNQFVQEYWV